MGVVILVYLAVIILEIVSMWVVFQKAGQPGWGAIIPIYNIYLFVKVAGRPGWWLILLLIPVVNIIVDIIISLDIARNFGKSGGFGVGLFLLGFIFFPVLAFGGARYQLSTA